MYGTDGMCVYFYSNCSRSLCSTFILLDYGRVTDFKNLDKVDNRTLCEYTAVQSWMNSASQLSWIVLPVIV